MKVGMPVPLQAMPQQLILTSSNAVCIGFRIDRSYPLVAVVKVEADLWIKNPATFQMKPRYNIHEGLS